MALITRGNNMRLLRGGRVQAMIMPGKPRDDTPPQPVFSPADLFAAGEPGIFFDLSDFSNLFQDAAGTIPVTAIEQPVGLILDKSKGLVIGSELVTNGTFDSATGWALGLGWDITGGQLVATPSTGFLATNVGTVTAGKWYLVSATITLVSGNVSLNLGTSGPIISSSVTYTNRLFLATATGAISFQHRGTGFTGTIDNVSVRELSGNHAYQSTTTSRPILRQDAGLKYYLDFDGTDDWLATGNIDFSATDKISVFAGVRKLSDSQQRIIAELSATIASNNGSFMLSGPNSAAANYNFSSKGTSQDDNTVTAYAAPISNVITGLADIAAPTNIIRINQVATALNTSQGTGNYGNFPLYIGRRGGTTLPFRGHLYSLIIRGALTSSPQLEQTEQWIAAKTGVTL